MHRKETKRRRDAAVLAILIAQTFLAAMRCPAEEFGGPFAAAIAGAQARTVKVYGAGIGRVSGYASGIIVSSDGQILVAQGVYLTGETIRVVLPDGSVHLAKTERRSRPLQTALLKIDAKTPDYFEILEKPTVHKGDWVIGVSNAFKVANGDEKLSVNLGIVSLRTRLEAKRGKQDVPYAAEVLLIDAITSNPGAPGGAVVTADGQLAGMIGRIIESKSTQTRLNYAVPSDLLYKFLTGRPIETPAAVTGSKVELGIRLFALGGKRSPAFIDRVVPGSPAAKAGLKADDLILAVGSERIRNARDYKGAIKTLVAGKPVEFQIKRKQKVLRIPVTPLAEKEGK